MKKFFIITIFCIQAIAAFTADPDIFRDGEAAPATVAIGRMVKTPVMDGSLTDWPVDTTSILLGSNTQTGRRFPWGGTRDVSGAIQMAWDKTYFYIGADVNDDKVLQANGGAEVWQGDTLELFFNTFPRQQRLDGFFQQAIVPNIKPEAKLTTTGPPKLFEGVEGATQLRPTGYTMECRIPWKNLAGFTPAFGTSLGFQVYIDDRDSTGRKTQLLWYPSAISFAQPTHTNILLLRDRGQTSLPQVLAGPNNWCVTDANNMMVSAIADVEGAKTAIITAIAPYPDPAHIPASATISLTRSGERTSIGQTNISVKDCEGLYNFSVCVMNEKGQTLTTNSFQAQLVGTKYQQMRTMNNDLKTRIDIIKKRDDLDPILRAGVAAWYTRVTSFVFNEARPEAVNAILLNQMLVEYDDINNALTTLENGKDPYEGRTGSFVRAYRSPLTAQPWQYALYVPTSYKPKSEKGIPLIVLLHSIFADERMLSQMTDTFKDTGAIVYQGAAYRQFDWGGISAAETWGGLNEVKRLYNIDEDRVYLVGYHIGGRGTWQLAMARPDLWAAAAPIFSGIDTGPNYPAMRLYPEYFDTAINSRIPNNRPPAQPEKIVNPLEKKLFEQASLVSRLENIINIPLRSAFGEDDFNAAAERLAMQQRLADLGIILNTHYVPGAMHGSPADEIRDPAFYQWLLANKRQPYPKQVKFTATNLRDNSAWWVSIDQLSSPAEVASINGKIDNQNVTVTTSNANAISLLLDKRLAPVGTPLSISVDTQPAITATIDEAPATIKLIRTDGKWSVGNVPVGQKRHSLSGPIDDFQRDRFVFIYGTGGDDAQKAALEKRGKKMADWGLGAIFPVKADTDVNDDDIKNANLILIGNPANNQIIAKIADGLPIHWTETGITLGGIVANGPGASACLTFPNPLSPDHYVVIVTSVDDYGYQIWENRNPGGDYVIGKTNPNQDKPTYMVSVRGWFTNNWKWSDDLCIKYDK
jgi:dienelactone hydrolase